MSRTSPYFDEDIIHADDEDYYFIRDPRSAFAVGIEGHVAWMRHVADYNDAVHDVHATAFDDAFRKSLRGKK